MSKYEVSSASGAEALLSRYGSIQREQNDITEVSSETDESKTQAAENCEPAGKGFTMIREPADELHGPKLSVIVSSELDSALEDALIALRRKKGVRLKKSHVLRDGIQNFVYGLDMTCPAGHRFILPPQEDLSGKDLFHCPVCGASVSKN